jgi:hypothetical protein
MTIYEVIGILLVVVIVLIIRNKIKNKKDAVAAQTRAANVAEMEEQKIEVNNNSETSGGSLDSLHWAVALMSEVENEPDLRNTPLSNELNEVVKKVIAIPYDFNELGNKSQYQLVVESGYLDVHDQITKGVIFDALTKQPGRIKEWVQWSEDQRVSEGWFLRENNGVSQIGAFSTKDGYKETLTTHLDLASACATFIKLQVECTRKLVESDNKKRKKKK